MLLWDRAVGPSKRNPTYDVIADAKLAGNPTLRTDCRSFLGEAATNIFGLLPCQLRLAAVSSSIVMSRRGHSSLRISIANVIALSSNKEVIRPDALTIVATVQNKQAIWDRSKGQFPYDAMGSDGSMVRFVGQTAVTIASNCAGPLPTRVLVIDDGDFTPSAIRNGSLEFMSLEVANWCPSDVPHGAVSLTGNQGALSASAHTQTRRVGSIGLKSIKLVLTTARKRTESRWPLNRDLGTVAPEVGTASLARKPNPTCVIFIGHFGSLQTGLSGCRSGDDDSRCPDFRCLNYTSGVERTSVFALAA